MVEGTGSEIFVKLDCGGEQISCLFRERLQIRFGDAIGIAIDPASVHLFDKASGRRL
jgi:multiple sugar transport system ATP-binding protein